MLIRTWKPGNEHVDGNVLHLLFPLSSIERRGTFCQTALGLKPSTSCKIQLFFFLCFSCSFSLCQNPVIDLNFTWSLRVLQLGMCSKFSHYLITRSTWAWPLVFKVYLLFGLFILFGHSEYQEWFIIRALSCLFYLHRGISRKRRSIQLYGEWRFAAAFSLKLLAQFVSWGVWPLASVLPRCFSLTLPPL